LESLGKLCSSGEIIRLIFKPLYNLFVKFIPEYSFLNVLNLLEHIPDR
jgi:hypothetical protein